MSNEFINTIHITLLSSRKFENQVSCFPAIELKFKGDLSEFSDFAKINLEDSKGFKCIYITQNKNEDGDIIYDSTLLDLPEILYIKDEDTDKNVYVYLNGKHEKIGHVVNVF